MRIITLDSGYKSWGRQGENLATILKMDASCLYAEYPNGMPVVAFARADGSKYLIACEIDDNHIVSVTLTSVDTDISGTVYVELQWMQDDVLKKSITYKGNIEKSIHDIDEPPEVEPSWSQQINQRVGNLNLLNTDNKSSLVAAINELYNVITDVGYYDTLSKIKDYLYEISYTDIDYDYACAYFENHSIDLPIGACSSVRNGNYYGRNFDWLYDNHAEFIVRTSADSGRNNVLGVSGSLTNLTDEFVSSGKKSIQYKMIPFYIVDGINQHGLTVNANVVPADKGTNIAIPTGESELKINSMMLVRYILDNFSTAWDVADYICEHVTVCPYKKLNDMHYELHWMIADMEHTVLLEIVNNKMVATDISNHPYMTNFYLNGATFNADGTVYTPYTQDATHNAVSTNGITENGSGLERWNYIVDHYEPSWTKAGMRTLMDNLKYTKAYTITDPEDIWYTEFVGMYDTTAGTPYAEFAPAISAAKQAYESRTRDNPQLWQSVHSCVYNMQDKILYVIAQEDGQELQFNLA